MGERAKTIVNDLTALELLRSKSFNIDKYYSSDLKIFVQAAQKEIRKVNDLLIKCDDYYKDKLTLKNKLKNTEDFIRQNIFTETQQPGDNKIYKMILTEEEYEKLMKGMIA